MTTTQPGQGPGHVIGRDDELAGGDRFLDAIVNDAGVLCVEGEPGIGKTTVWGEICARASRRSYTLLTCKPVASESELPFAGLIDLIGGHADAVLPRLPEPQRRALEVALLRATGGADGVSRLATSAAFVNVLSCLAHEAPVIVGIDDLQWLDPPTLGLVQFAARRLGSLPVGILASIRVASALDPDVPIVDLGVEVDRVRLGPLPIGSLYHVIEANLGMSLRRSTLVEIGNVSDGNPFFALQVARTLSQGAAADAPPVPDNLSRLLSARIEGLPVSTRDALLAASMLSRPTAGRVPAADLRPAENEGIISVEADGRVRFSHPLFAHAVSASASSDERARRHLALSHQVTDPDERARHLALASTEPDEHIAAMLDDAAERARARGAPQVAAELEERAAQRTPSNLTLKTMTRRLRAAEHHARAGDAERASDLARLISSEATTPWIKSRAFEVLAEISYGRSFPDAAGFLEKALACSGDDPRREAELEVQIAFAGVSTMDFDTSLQHVRHAEQLAGTLDDGGLLAEALGLRVYFEAVVSGHLDEAARQRSLELEDPSRDRPIQLRPSQNAAILDVLRGDLEPARSAFLDLRQKILDAGEEHELPWALNELGTIELLRGDLAVAGDYIEDARGTATAVGSDTLRGFALALQALLEAFAGDETSAVAHAREALHVCDMVGWMIGSLYARKALGFLALSRGDMGSVDEALGQVAELAVAIKGSAVTAFFVEDVIDACIASGDLERAARVIHALAEGGRSLDAPWALATAARGQALLESARGEHDAAMAAVGRALTEHERLPMPFELARTLLAQGQILRRRRQKRAARETLEQARAMFEDLGMTRWVENATAELARVGLRSASPTDLTETERRVAELAASGLTNREIAGQAFLSPKTVEDVLSRVYRKLGIRSRAQLGAHLPEAAPE